LKKGPRDGAFQRHQVCARDMVAIDFSETHDQLRKHLADFVAAYNYARRLKTLRGLTPYEAICKVWAENPSLFTADPHHQLPGPNI
jgi:hypothetical protein